MNKKYDFSMPGIRRSIAVKAAACLAAFALLAVNHGGAMTELRHMPSAVFAEDEEALRVRLGSFSANGVTVSVGSSLDERLGERTASCRTLGGIVVRSIPVFVGERPRLTPGGEAVGISIYTDGVLIVGIGELERQGGGRVSPAGEAVPWL